MPEPQQQRFSLITDKSLNELKKLIDVPIEDSLEPWCYEATRDNIRHWAHGIGDDNPLWCEPAYAAKTHYRRIVAPPSFIFPLNRSFSGYVGGLPGVHAMFAGIDVTWHKPMLLGDEYTTKAWLKELIEHETRFAGRSIQQVYRCEFYKQGGELVAEGDSWCFRTERDTARERGTKYDEVKKKKPVFYSRDDLARIFRHYEQEEVRGATPRYIEDVKADDRHRIHLLRAGMGRSLRPRQQARLETASEASGAGDSQQVRHPRRARARALGGRPRDAGGNAGGVRLRPGAMLLDVASSYELDGRRRVPAAYTHRDSPPQSGRRHALYQRGSDAGLR